MKELSFIIPSYQQGPYLRTCLDSIGGQDLARDVYEILVFDGGSTDETIRILESHPLAPVWVSEPDKGQTSAVNRGFASASGEILAWINSDDYFLPGVFPKLLAFFKDNPSVSIAYGEADWVDERGATLGAYPVEDWNFRRLADKCFLCQPAVVFRRSILDTVGFLDDSYHIAMDLEFWLRIGKVQEFSRIPLKIAASRLYDGNKSRSFPLRMQLEALKAGYAYQDRLSEKRLWSVAENRVFARRSGLRRRIQCQESGWWERFMFWPEKICAYIRLRVNILRSHLPWDELTDTLPRQPEAGA